jgi:capsular exopolysaccharide synthesis family protein
MGYKTLLIGCNLRRPTLYKVFGLEIGPGVKDISLGLVDWRACVRTINDVATGMMTVTEDFLRDGAWSRLNIITCGGIYHNPTEVFSTPKMRKFLEEVKKEYDLVLIDCPPVLPVTDAAILGSKVDGCIMVYQVGKIARGALKRAKLHLESANIRVLGVVLNDFRAEISGFAPDTAYYGKYYGDGAESVQKPRYQKFLDQLSTSRERTGQMWAKISAMFRKKPPLPLVAAEEEVSRAEAVKEENAVNSNNNTGGNEEKQT